MAKNNYKVTMSADFDDESLEKIKSKVEKAKETISSPVNIPIKVDEQKAEIKVHTEEATAKIKSLEEAIANAKKQFSFKDYKTDGDPLSEVYDKIIADNKELVASMGNMKEQVESIFAELKKTGGMDDYGLTTDQIKEQIRLQLQLSEIQAQARQKAGEIFTSKSYMDDPEKLKELIRSLKEINAITERNKSDDPFMQKLFESDQLADIAGTFKSIVDTSTNTKIEISDVFKTLSGQRQEIVSGWKSSLVELQNASDQTAAQVVSDQKEQTQAIQETARAQDSASAGHASVVVDKAALLASVQDALNAVDEMVRARRIPIAFDFTIDENNVKQQIESIAARDVKIPIVFDSSSVQARVTEIINKLNDGFNTNGFISAMQSMEPAFAGVTGKLHIAVETWRAELGLFNNAIIGTRNRLTELQAQIGAGGTATLNADGATQNIDLMKRKIEELRTLLSNMTIDLVLNEKSYERIRKTLTKMREDAKNIPVKFQADSDLQRSLQAQIKRIEAAVRRVRIQFNAPVGETRKVINDTLDAVQKHGLHKIRVDFYTQKSATLEKINAAIDSAGGRFDAYNDKLITKSAAQEVALKRVLEVLKSTRDTLGEISVLAGQVKNLNITKQAQSKARSSGDASAINVDETRKAAQKALDEIEKFRVKRDQILMKSTGVNNFLSGEYEYVDVERLRQAEAAIGAFYRSSSAEISKGGQAAQNVIDKTAEMTKNFDALEKKLRVTGREMQGLKVDPQSADVVDRVREALERRAGSEAKVIRTTQQANGEYTKIIATMREANGEIKQYTTRVNNTTGAVEMMGEATTRTNSVLDRFLNSFRNKGVELATYLTTFASFYQIMNQVRKGIGIVTEIDTAMTELRKVSNDAESALNGFERTAFSIGQTVGATGDAVINLAADYSRLGYSLAEASELARNSAIYMNVSELNSTADATEHLVSILKAYGISANDVSMVIDRLNEVGKVMPVNGYIGQRVGTPETEQRLSLVLRMRNDCGQRVVTSVVKPIHVRISYHM